MSEQPQPFFEAAHGRRSARRLLLLSYHFPPGDAVGALRWQKLSQQASLRDWEIDVVTVHPDSLMRPDPSRLGELPPGTRVYGAPATRLLMDDIERFVWSTFQRFRRSGRTQGRSSVTGGPTRLRPHSMSRAEILGHPMSSRVAIRSYYAYLYHLRNRRWAGRAEALARSVMKWQRPHAVISCGPPHEAHVAGSRLGQEFTLPHVVDMRDPWSLVERVPEIIAAPITYRIAERDEAKVLAGASLIVCNTDPAAEALRLRYRAVAERCITVMNGFDADVLPPRRLETRFLIGYAGSIYLDRDPEALFRGAAQVIQELGLTPAEFAIEFMGHEEIAAGPTVLEIAAQEGIAPFVRRHPPGSRRQALEFLAGAAMLISLPQDSNMAIPSKVFEYMRYDAWLLALADRDSATARLLSRGDADVVAPDDVSAIARVIRARYTAFREGRVPQQPALVPSSSRAEQARVFFEALDRVIR